MCEVLFDPRRQQLEAQLEEFMDANAEAEEEWYLQQEDHQALIEQRDAQIADLVAECDEAWAAVDDAEAHLAAAKCAANAAEARLADAMDANAVAKAEWERSQARYAGAEAVMRLQQAPAHELAAERDEAEAAAAEAQQQRDSWRQLAMHMQLRFTARTMQLLEVSHFKHGASAEDDDNRRTMWLVNECASALQQLADVPAQDLKAMVDGARSACDTDAALSHQTPAPADEWKQQLQKAGRLAEALAACTLSSSGSADSTAPCDSQQVAAKQVGQAPATPQKAPAAQDAADDMQPVTPPLPSLRRCRPAQDSDQE